MNTRFIAAVAILAMVLTAVPYVCADESDAQYQYIAVEFYDGGELVDAPRVGPFSYVLDDVPKVSKEGYRFLGWEDDAGKFYEGNSLKGTDMSSYLKVGYEVTRVQMSAVFEPLPEPAPEEPKNYLENMNVTLLLCALALIGVAGVYVLAGRSH